MIGKTPEEKGTVVFRINDENAYPHPMLYRCAYKTVKTTNTYRNIPKYKQPNKDRRLCYGLY